MNPVSIAAADPVGQARRSRRQVSVDCYGEGGDTACRRPSPRLGRVAAVDDARSAGATAGRPPCGPASFSISLPMRGPTPRQHRHRRKQGKKNFRPQGGISRRRLTGCSRVGLYLMPGPRDSRHMDESALDIRRKRIRFRSWHRGYPRGGPAASAALPSRMWHGMDASRARQVRSAAGEPRPDLYAWITGRDDRIPPRARPRRHDVAAAGSRSAASTVPEPASAAIIGRGPARGSIVAGAPEGMDARRAGCAGTRAGRRPASCMSRSTTPRMAALAERSPSSRPTSSVLTFPAWDCLPYDRVSPNAEIAARRIDTSDAAERACRQAARRASC